MQNVIGLAFFAFGALFFVAALRYRRRVVVAWARYHASMSPGTQPPRQRFGGFAARARPFITFALQLFAIETILMYFFFNGDRLFSLFDLAGWLFLLTGYGTWINLHIVSRPPPAGAVSEVTDDAGAAVPPLGD